MNRRHLLTALTLSAATPALAAKPSAAQKLVLAAESQIGITVRYDPAYEKLAYPMGDVAMERGVCTDVVIRAYRKGLGLDLQKLVHDDMRKNFAKYPAIWGLDGPDPNIDHRRVPNLQCFFKRHNAALMDTEYAPGDLVTLVLPGNLPHIAIVSGQQNTEGSRYLVIHNIGGGTQREDVLERYPTTGHHRFFPVS